MRRYSWEVYPCRAQIEKVFEILLFLVGWTLTRILPSLPTIRTSRKAGHFVLMSSFLQIKMVEHSTSINSIDWTRSAKYWRRKLEIEGSLEISLPHLLLVSRDLPADGEKIVRSEAEETAQTKYRLPVALLLPPKRQKKSSHSYGTTQNEQRSSPLPSTLRPIQIILHRQTVRSRDPGETSWNRPPRPHIRQIVQFPHAKYRSHRTGISAFICILWTRRHQPQMSYYVSFIEGQFYPLNHYIQQRRCHIPAFSVSEVLDPEICAIWLRRGRTTSTEFPYTQRGSCQ